MQNISLVAGEDAVLLLHGLAGSPREMRYLAKLLHRWGYSVAVPHIPGYGHGGKATDWRNWHDHVSGIFDNLRREYRTVSVGGLCIGAVLALSLAAEKSRDIAALSLLSTTLAYDGWSIPWYRFLLPLGYYTFLRRTYSYPEREPYGLKNELLRKRIARAMQQEALTEIGASSIPMNHIYQATRLIGHVKRNVGHVEAPALVVHAVDDDTASIKSADFVVAHIGSRNVRKVVLSDSYHIVTMDNERELVARETRDFFQEQIGSARPREIRKLTAGQRVANS
jgi:carboxylesterase